MILKKYLLIGLSIFVYLTLLGCGLRGKDIVNGNEVLDAHMSIMGVEAEHSINDSTVGIYLMKDIKLYEPGEEIYYGVYGENVGATLSIEVEMQNEHFNISEAHIYNDSGTFDEQNYFIAEKMGLYDIEFRVYNGNNLAYIHSITIGVMEQPGGPADDTFYFGLHSFLFRIYHWGGYTFENTTREETFDLTWKYMDYLGINLIRDGDAFSTMQPTSRADTDFYLNDMIVNSAYDRGVSVNWYMGATPRWALKDEYKDVTADVWAYPPKMEYWISYIEDVAEHYKDYDNIIYEIVNEPNWEFWRGTAEEYLDLLDQTARTMKSINPSATIIPGGMVPGIYLEGEWLKDSNLYYEKYKELLDEDLIDYIAYHAH